MNLIYRTWWRSSFSLKTALRDLLVPMIDLPPLASIPMFEGRWFHYRRRIRRYSFAMRLWMVDYLRWLCSSSSPFPRWSDPWQRANID